MECGAYYTIIYDDKGHHPVRKEGIIKSFHGNLIEFESGEILNSNFVIRANKVEGGINANKHKTKEIKTIRLYTS